VPGLNADRRRDDEIAVALLRWYGESARDLPWRRTRDPYGVWISEVMLQQTRVDTVIPYFARFLRRFPDVRTLASAPLDDVLELWSGLGYYRRARELHAAAREVVTRYGGALPREVTELRTLRGVGRYTAGAIASIAFGRAEPLVDGNVARVLARVFGIAHDVRSARGSRELWVTAARLVPPRDPGAFNQALMELGATICLPRAPLCSACPVRATCVAYRDGRQAELPLLRAKAAPKPVRIVAAVIRARGRVLFARRAPSGLFGGLWEPPMVEARSIRSAQSSLKEIGVNVDRIDLIAAGSVRHVLSHRALEILVARADVPKPFAARRMAHPYEQSAWVDLDAAPLGISTLARKVLTLASGPPLTK
jgi:A/G-specific adenine glycosylase